MFVATEEILRKFKTLCTDFGKLKKLPRLGSGAKKLTNLQLWKLNRFRFLDAHISRRMHGQELGMVSIEKLN